jgi:hypothetical protein
MLIPLILLGPLRLLHTSSTHHGINHPGGIIASRMFSGVSEERKPAAPRVWVEVENMDPRKPLTARLGDFLAAYVAFFGLLADTPRPTETCSRG